MAAGTESRARGRTLLAAGAWAWPALVPAALLVVVSLLGSLGPPSLDRITVTMIIHCTVVVGLYVFVGNSGVFSFGHMSFMAIGAYTCALLTMPVATKAETLDELPGFLAGAHFGVIPATLIAGGVAAAAALVLAVPLMRISGLAAGLGTLAVLLIVNVVSKNWQEVTHGTAGIGPVPISTTRDSALVWALIAIGAAFLFQHSTFGRRLRASREDEVAARMIGVNVARERGIAFVLSAFLTGVGGALFGNYLGAFSPDAFYINITFLTIAMLVVGGQTSLAGAVVGTIVVSSLNEGLRRIEGEVSVTGLTEVALAVCMLGILVLRPSGITAGREITWPFARVRARRRPAPAAAPETLSTSVHQQG